MNERNERKLQELATCLENNKQKIIEKWRKLALSDQSLEKFKGMEEQFLVEQMSDFLDSIIWSIDQYHNIEDLMQYKGKGNNEGSLHNNIKLMVSVGYSMPDTLKELSLLRYAIFNVCSTYLHNIEVINFLNMAIDFAIAELADDIHRFHLEEQKANWAGREQFRLMVEGVEEYAIFMIDLTGKIINWNPGVKRVLGYDEKEWIGRHVSIIYTPEDQAKKSSEEEMERTLENGKSFDKRWHVKKGGEYFWADGVDYSIQSEEGELIGFAKLMADKTKEKLAAQKLEEAEQRFREIADHITESFWIWDVAKQRFEYLNPASEQVYGVSCSELLNYSFERFMELVYADDRMRVIEVFRRQIDGEITAFEYRLLRRGEIAWVSVAAAPVRNQDGEIYRIIGTTKDITERKKREEELAEQAELLNLTADAILICDMNSKIIFWNESATSLYGWTKEEALNSLSHELLKTIFPISLDEINKSLEKTGHWSGELIHTNRQGEQVIVMSRWAIQFSSSSGKPIKIFKTNTDITDRKKAEVALAKAKDEAEQANRAKSAFLSMMSHEIRTPLSAIVGFSELLRDLSLSVESRKEFIDIIGRNCCELTRLIDDILDLSKVEAGHIAIEKMSVFVSDLVADVMRSLTPKAQQKGIALNVYFDSNVPVTIISDPTRLRQILLNIIDNAVKFTEKGRVDVQVKLFGHSPNENPKMAFIVKDTGIGLSLQAQMRLFKPFTQADTSTTRKYGGTGLGLILARELARALGGDVILAESNIGHGSTFIITVDPGEIEKTTINKIACESANALCDRQEAAKKLEGAKILIAEDSPDNQQLVQMILEREGASVSFADNGADALNMALAKNFDLILMDMQMPILDGYEATKELRRLGYEQPIIALTAHAMREERDKCLKVGCSDYVTKPIKQKDLIYLISQYI